jgi:uncharacterized membrane protein YbhN (UPF0104 family)
VKSKRLKLALRIAAIAAVAGLVYFAARTVDLRALGHALVTASVGPLALACFLFVGNQLARAGYWRTILLPVAPIPLGTMFRYTLAGSATSLVVPARGGEALRVWWLNKRHDVPLPVLAAGVAFEKMLDATLLVFLVAPLPWLLESEKWLGPVKFAIPVALVGLPLSLVIVRRLKQRIRWLANVRVFDTLSPLFVSLAWVVAAWLLDLSTIALVMVSLGVPVQIEAVLLVLLIVNLAVAVPAAPGNLGTFELGAAFALTTMKVPSEKAAAAALLYHGVQIVPVLLVWGVGELTGRLTGKGGPRHPAG